MKKILHTRLDLTLIRAIIEYYIFQILYMDKIQVYRGIYDILLKGIVKLCPYICYIALCYYITTQTSVYIDINNTFSQLMVPILKLEIFKLDLSISGEYSFIATKLKCLNGRLPVCTCVFIYFLVTIPLLLILENIVLFILYILAFVFIKAIFTNFYDKHIGWFKNTGCFAKNKGKLAYYMRWLRENYKIMIKFFIKFWITSFATTFLVRRAVWLLFSNNDIISYLLVIVLALPLVSYIINIIMKLLKKEEIKEKDLYIFNDYVLDKVNLFRVSYLLFITIMYRTFYMYWIIAIGIIIPLLVVFLLLLLYLWMYKIKTLPKPVYKNKSGTIGRLAPTLEAKPEPISAMLGPIIAIGGFYQAACNEGFGEYYAGEDPTNAINKPRYAKKERVWKQIWFSKPGEYYVGKKTVNITQTKNPLFQDNLKDKHKKHVEEARKYIAKSPILTMVYRQKNCIQTKEWGYLPASFFDNKTMYGSVAHVKKGNFVVINIILKKWNASVFMPTYYLPEDKQLDSKLRVEQAMTFIEQNYNIVLPMAPLRPEGMIIYTQAESLGGGVFRHWRPSLDFIEPYFLTGNTNIEEYYNLFELNHKRVEGFNNKNIIDKVKARVLENESITNLEERIVKELLTDKLYVKMLDSFLHVAPKMHPHEYCEFEEWPFHTRRGMTADSVVKAVNLEFREEEEREKERKAKDEEPSRFSAVKELEKALLKVESNNGSIDKETNKILSYRRDYHIDSSVWARKIPLCVYTRIDKTGVMEGFKSREQYLGKKDQHLYVPLSHSRIPLWEAIVKKFTGNGPYANYKMAAEAGVYEGRKLYQVYAISVNRLSFEFLEFRTRSEFNVKAHRNAKKWTQAYSIVDTHNNSLIAGLDTKSGKAVIQIPRHDYNFFNDKDEHSIRRIMDQIFITSEANTYKSYLSNSELPDNIYIDPEVNKWHQWHYKKDTEIDETNPWEKVSQEEIDKYLKTTRHTAWAADPNSVLPLDREIIEQEVTRILRKKKTYDHQISTGEKVKRKPQIKMTPAKIARYAQAAAELEEEARVKRELREEKIRLEAEEDQIMEDFTVQGDFTVPMEIDEPAADNETSTSDKDISKPDSARSKPNRVYKPYRPISKPDRPRSGPESRSKEGEKVQTTKFSQTRKARQYGKFARVTDLTLETVPEEIEMEPPVDKPVDKPMDIYSELELEDPRWDYEPLEDSIDTTMAQNFVDEFNIMLSSNQVENNMYSSIEEAETNRDFMSSTGMDTLEDEDLYSAD